MDKKKASEIWADIVRNYNATVLCGSHGTTGSPEDALRLCLKANSREEIREVLGIVAHIKAHDGRFWDGTREWLYAGVTEQKADWYMAYAGFGGIMGLDDIHTAHINNIANCLRNKWDDFALFADGEAFVDELHKEHGLLEAYNIAKRYLDMQEGRGLGKTWRDLQEEVFCEGVRKGLRILDMI